MSNYHRGQQDTTRNHLHLTTQFSRARKRTISTSSGGRKSVQKVDNNYSPMCEIHYLKCAACGCRWEAHRKLASCESFDPAVRCPENLVMYVGAARRPEKGECTACREMMEVLETLEDD